jgi:signal transduction histidine kinase
VTGPRLTVRARLTLIYTGLFALCGAIIIAVSYILVAQLGATVTTQGSQTSNVAESTLKQCKIEQNSPHPDKRILAKCNQAFQKAGAKEQRALTLSHLLEYSLITLGAVIALAALLGWIFAGRALRPVQQITAAARAASETNLSSRVALTGPRDELRELAETFDDMLDRLQAAFEGQQRFIANASHELRTPLTVMRTAVDVVLGNPNSTPDDLRGMAADIRIEVDRAEHLIGALLLLARNDRGLTVHEELDLATIAEDVLDMTNPTDRILHANLEPAVISGDPVLAEHLISNLVDNAIRYNAPGGEIWISTRVAPGGSEVVVANTGPVISQGEAEYIFQPFQRLGGRTSHDGSGLGLTIVSSIASIHGGTATATPRDGGGLTVTVTIPSVGTATRQPSGAVADDGEVRV